MAELRFDHPVIALTDEEDAETLAAIEEGVGQLDRGEGYPIEELRQELVRRCSE